MNDNFDSNVAQRKPLIRKSRPAHPWDVKVHDQKKDAKTTHNTDDSTESENIESSQAVITSDVPAEKKVSPVLRTVKGKVHDRETHRRHPSLRDSDGLSDSININSNYCKLHNDVSDTLLRHLSPSSQAVYIRLYRQSYGWNRNWAAESLPKLTTACNLSLQTVRKAIKELESFGCIKKQFSDYHKATVYRIFLPSEISMVNNYMVNTTGSTNRGQNIDSLTEPYGISDGQFSALLPSGDQTADTDRKYEGDLKNLDTENVFSGGQGIDIQSIYFSGSSIYVLLKQGGALPKNIYTYMNNKHLAHAVDIIDEFYDSIGFSIVSRSQYRKSLIDYFEMIKSGFSSDDIRYAVRWTFKNSRSRPESFSLIKHTMHLAMEDLIKELKDVAGEKDLAREKQEALKRKAETEMEQSASNLDEKAVETWRAVVEDLRENMNENSFSAFIEPLKLIAAEDDRVVVSSPPDSLSWVVDHFVEKIEESYREKIGKEITVEVV